MSGGYRTGQPPTELAELIDELDDIERRLQTLEAPTEEQTYQTVAKLSALVENIQAQLDAWVTTRWTNAQVQSAINTSISSFAAGNQTIGGVTLSGGYVFSPNAYSYDITYTRRTAWLGNDGRLAWASSSARKKTGIREADESRLLALLDIVPKSFIYRAELARRTNLRINEGIDYVPKRELGLIAEELDAAGLHEFVNYGEDGLPEGIEYGMLVVALLAIDRAQRDEIAELRADVNALKAAAG